MDRAEIKKRFDQIVEFSGIEKYLETPVKRYSSGMYARLGYSVAAHVDPEILLVDEVLAVGDMAFQRKCYDHMRQLIKDGTTLVFVSHNLQAIQRVCDRCIVMYRGNNVFEGAAADGVAAYSNVLREAAAEFNEVGERIERGLSQQILTHAAKIENVVVLNEAGEEALSFESGERVLVRAKVKFNQDAKSPVFAFSIRQPDGQMAYDFTTHWAELEVQDFKANTTALIEYPLELNLAAGTYHLGVNLAYHDLSLYYDRLDRFQDIVVVGGSGARGVANLKAGFRVAGIEDNSSDSLN
jgi:ABC-type multidrug transport system ATPase subunit